MLYCEYQLAKELGGEWLAGLIQRQFAKLQLDSRELERRVPMNEEVEQWSRY